MQEKSASAQMIVSVLHTENLRDAGRTSVGGIEDLVVQFSAHKAQGEKSMRAALEAVSRVSVL